MYLINYKYGNSFLEFELLDHHHIVVVAVPCVHEETHHCKCQKISREPAAW